MDDVATLEPPAASGAPGLSDLRLDDGVELLGRYQGSGLREAPYLIRRPDGQVIQVSHLIYLVATALHPDDETRDLDLGKVATAVSDAYGREVTAENVGYLITQKLLPTGVVRAPANLADDPDTGGGTDAGRSAPRADEARRAKPLLALRMRVPLVPARAHRVVTRALVPLFRVPIILAALAAMVAVDVGLWHRREALAWGLRGVIYQPQLLLMVTLLTFAAAAFHELGHAAAARKGGAQPGAMGAGIYLVWPVFYTDVSDSYRLSRRGRLRTDLGGVYFNVLFALGVAAVYGLTGFEPLLVSLVLIQVETLRQFLPFVRLDGYYVVSDLAGVPNLFSYMSPVLVGLLRRRDDAVRRAARAKLRELNRGARALIIAWVAVTTPVLLVNLVVLLVVAPRLAGAAWGSAGGQLRAMVAPDGALDPFRLANGVIGLVLLVLPVLGIGYIAVRFTRRIGTLAGAWWRNRPAPTAVALAAVTVVVVLQVSLVWPDAFADALRHAQESPAVEDAPAQIAGPPVRPHPAPELAAPAPPATAPPAPSTAPTSGSVGDSSGDDESRSSGGGAVPSTSSSSTAAPTTTSTSAGEEPGAGGSRAPSPTTTTTTVPPTSTTAPPTFADDPLAAVLALLFPPAG